MDLYECRRQRLEVLIKDGAAPTAIAERTKIAASTVSRWRLNPGDKNAKNIGERSARKIEAAFRKPRYWLDGEPTPAARNQSVERAAAPLTQPEEPPVVGALGVLSEALAADIPDERREAIGHHLEKLATHRGSKLHLDLLIGLMKPQLVSQETGKPALKLKPLPTSGQGAETKREHDGEAHSES